ncbi:MAG: amidohydrolase, partial [Bacteroidia bacterium]
MKHILLFISMLAVSMPTVFAQKDKDKKANTEKKEEKKEDKWDIAKPFGPSKEVSFTVREGTWMNLDVSPDGKEVVFDLLGDIYLMPIEGGEAKCIAQGAAYEVQPRFSPDGKKIAFTSDRAGGDNIWYMDKDGKNPKQVTKEAFRLLNNPVWTKDGQYLIARKHFTNTRSLGAGEMWMYHHTGGEGIQLTKRKNDQMDAGEPCLSPDNQYLYFSEDMSGGGFFQYNKDVNGQIYAIRRYNMQTGELDYLTGGSGGACRPQVSPDGKKLAFVKRVRFQSVLYIHDLETGEEYPVFDKLSRDQQETWAIFGVYPNFNWLPDSKEVMIYAQGRFYRVNTENFVSTAVTFTANVKQTIVEAINVKQEAYSEEFSAKMIRHATTSPDGKYLAFNAAGHIYLKELPNGKPNRLTNDATHFEFEPAFSSDGSKIVYTTWSDMEKGAICVINVANLGQAGTPLTKDKGFYFSPSFGDNDTKIAYTKGGGNNMLGYSHAKNTGIYVMNSDGSKPKLMIKDAGSPILSKDGTKIYFLDDPGMNKSFKMMNLETREIKTLLTSKYATQFSISPDENWVAFTDLYQCYVAAFPHNGKEIDVSGNMGSVPVKKVTRDAGTCLHWSGDSKSLNWVLGPKYFSRKISDSFTFVDAKDSLPPIDTAGVDIGLKFKSDKPEGKVAFTNARIITMEKDKVIENGYIVVEGNKIIQVGEGAVKIQPKEGEKFTEVDCQGKTIIPGFVDVHAHLGASYNGISPQQQWGYVANLAYGVTTTHDPSNSTEMVFSQHEMVENGEMIGPRIFSTGTILYGADGDFKAVVNSLEDARTHLRRMKAVGAFSVKSYNQPRRDQRQQVLQAARELNMHVYPEGGSTFFHNMTQVIDGHTGIEHSIPIPQVYEDVVKLWGNTKV